MKMEMFTFKNMFTLTCSILTLVLIYQVMFTYLVTKPTTSAKEGKELEITDLPEVVVCLDPGLNYESLEKNGYYGSYVSGQLVFGGKFVGWNGGEHGNKSSLGHTF